MTTPDGSVPGGAVNAGSLAEFAAKTEEDWRAEMQADAERTWGDTWLDWDGVDGLGTGLLGAFFQGLNRDKPLVLAILEALADAMGLGGVWDTVEGVLAGISEFFSNLVGDVLNAFRKLAEFLGLDGIWDTITDVTDAIAAFINGGFSDLRTWVRALFQRIADWLNLGQIWDTIEDLVDGIGDFIKKITSNIINAILGAGSWTLDHLKDFFAGFVQGAGSLLKQIVAGIVGIFNGDALTALKNWFAGFVNGDGSLLQQIAKAITGAVGGGLSTIRTWANTLFTDLKNLIDGIWQKFTGGTAIGKTVAEAIASIGSWLSNAWQRLVDGIADVWTPGNGTGRPVQDAINAVLGILGVGVDAGNSAANANIGVESIRAELAGGTVDEFDYVAADWLPNTSYSYYTSGNGTSTFGPEGGKLVWKNITITPVKDVVYRRIGPLAGDAATVKLVLSRRPRSTACLYACANMSAGDKACRRVKVLADGVEVQTVNASGVASSVGGITGVTVSDGDVIECRFTATQVEVAINGTLVARQNASALDANHREVGLGGYLPAFVGLQHPGGELVGWTWLPTATATARELE